MAAITGFLVFGASLAFLFFNYPPARIFMGDSGSLFLGVMASLLPFYSFPSVETRGFVLLFAATLFIIPILDTLAAIFRRNRKNQPFYTPDQEHLHHKLLTCGASNKTILTILYGITFLGAISVYWRILTGTAISMAAILSVWIGTLLFFYYMHRKVNSRSCSYRDVGGADGSDGSEDSTAEQENR
jgi:UDP-GlcNAc:undecaprenyl-phosphate GlcNAc-1-phosphate transferase